NDPERVGWREMLVQAGEGISARAVGSTPVPSADVSQELRHYPEDLLSSPLDVRQLSFVAVPAGGSPARPGAPSEQAPARAPGPGPRPAVLLLRGALPLPLHGGLRRSAHRRPPDPPGDRGRPADGDAPRGPARPLAGPRQDGGGGVPGGHPGDGHPGPRAR